MPSAKEMLRRVARDPIGQAKFFNLMIELFLVHVLGVLPKNGKNHTVSYADGIAASREGVFGVVQAYFGPIETQGRGGLHSHLHVWLLHPLTPAFLARVRSGVQIPGLRATLDAWRRGVLEKVASMQFDSIEEVGRQLNLPGNYDVPG